MSEPPAYEESSVKFVDQPHIATMLSGGIFLAIVVFFILQWFLSTLEIEQFSIVKFIIAGGVIVTSIYMGITPDVIIKMNTKTGYIKAETSTIQWEGYANEAEQFLVLQKRSVGRNGQQFTDYKLSLQVDEETTFEIPLKVSQVRNAINSVEETKEAVPNTKTEGEILN